MNEQGTCTVNINGTDYPIIQEVMDLMILTGKERDHYRDRHVKLICKIGNCRHNVTGECTTSPEITLAQTECVCKTMKLI